MTLVVKMQGKNLKSSIDYKKPSSTFLVGEVDKEADFLPSDKREEVKSNLMLGVMTTQIGILSFLQPTKAVHASTVTGLPTQVETAQVVIEVTQFLSMLGLGVGVVWLIATRLYYFHPKRRESEKAMETASNSIKGITQILAIPSIVWIIVNLANLLLGSSTNFQLPM
ncbi:hypothetical protein ACI2JA_03965 [Alkalihalobacillus sp. NPDC078783]